MIIGLDFDNTIVSYDSLFHRVALEKGLISEELPVNKVAVRDYLREKGQEPAWTEMQGYVYGSRLDEATSYPGVRKFFRWAINSGHFVKIISHKTLLPFSGPKYNLHDAARSWLNRHMIDKLGPLIEQHNAFFELTKLEKLNRIAAERCDVFLDDLPEILLAESFPSRTKRFLFDPEKNHLEKSNLPLEIISNWNAFQAHLMA
jgi:hypothetical protein